MPTAPPPTQAQQSQQQHHHARPALKKRHTGGRAGRPTALTQRFSYHGRTARHSQIKESSSKEHSDEEAEDDDSNSNDDTAEAAFGFLQYCTTCEKQISSPSSTVLYCSDRCRKKDVESSRSYTLFNHDASSSSTPPRSPIWRAAPPPIIIPQLSPTVMSRPMHTIQSDWPTSSDAAASSSTARGQDKTERPSTGRSDPEYSQYIAKPHTPSQSPPRVQQGHLSAATDVPGLSYTPATSTSSSVAYTPTSASHIPFNHRPNRWSASFSSRSIDLITPVTQYPTGPSSMSTVTDKHVASGSYGSANIPALAISSAEGLEAISYEKKRTIAMADSSPGRGSLKDLFQQEPTKVPASKDG